MTIIHCFKCGNTVTGKPYAQATEDEEYCIVDKKEKSVFLWKINDALCDSCYGGIYFYRKVKE